MAELVDAGDLKSLPGSRLGASSILAASTLPDFGPRDYFDPRIGGLVLASILARILFLGARIWGWPARGGWSALCS